MKIAEELEMTTINDNTSHNDHTSMLLQTDDQTMEDLGIFGRRNGSGIFDLYNHTHTRGGEALLREIFRTPLADKEAINRRILIMECFTRLYTRFPFEPTDFDMAEKYLQNTGEQSGNTPGRHRQIIRHRGFQLGMIDPGQPQYALSLVQDLGENESSFRCQFCHREIYVQPIDMFQQLPDPGAFPQPK